MTKRKKTSAQIQREIVEALNKPVRSGAARRGLHHVSQASKGALRDLIRRAREGEPGADMVATDAILQAGHSTERAERALAQRPISESVRDAVRRDTAKKAERREQAAQRAALRAPPGARRKANDEIYDLINNKYFRDIPLDEIFAIVERAGLHFDPEEKQVMLLGRDGQAKWDLFSASGNRVDPMLVMSWHKMDTTGRYEVVAYVS
jgi:hypothetical protein